MKGIGIPTQLYCLYCVCVHHEVIMCMCVSCDLQFCEEFLNNWFPMRVNEGSIQ